MSQSADNSDGKISFWNAIFGWYSVWKSQAVLCPEISLFVIRYAWIPFDSKYLFSSDRNGIIINIANSKCNQISGFYTNLMGIRCVCCCCCFVTVFPINFHLFDWNEWIDGKMQKGETNELNIFDHITDSWFQP